MRVLRNPCISEGNIRFLAFQLRDSVIFLQLIKYIYGYNMKQHGRSIPKAFTEPGLNAFPNSYSLNLFSKVIKQHLFSYLPYQPSPLFPFFPFSSLPSCFVSFLPFTFPFASRPSCHLRLLVQVCRA